MVARLESKPFGLPHDAQWPKKMCGLTACLTRVREWIVGKFAKIFKISAKISINIGDISPKFLDISNRGHWDPYIKESGFMVMRLRVVLISCGHACKMPHDRRCSLCNQNSFDKNAISWNSIIS